MITQFGHLCLPTWLFLETLLYIKFTHSLSYHFNPIQYVTSMSSVYHSISIFICSPVQCPCWLQWQDTCRLGLPSGCTSGRSHGNWRIGGCWHVDIPSACCWATLTEFYPFKVIWKVTLFCRIWEKAGTENCEAVENCVSIQWEISEVKHVLLQMLTDVGRKSRCSI